MIRLMQESGGNYLMQGPQKLRILVQQEEARKRFAESRRVLSELDPDKGK